MQGQGNKVHPAEVGEEDAVKEGNVTKAKKYYAEYNEYKGLSGIILNYELSDLNDKEPEMPIKFEQWAWSKFQDLLKVGFVFYMLY